MEPGRHRGDARAEQVLDEARELLARCEARRIWAAIARGAFADVKRTRDGRRGLAGVVERSPEYLNPILEALERRTMA